MVAKVIFLLYLFGVVSSKLPHMRECDPEERNQLPTICSNYKNLLHIYNFKKGLESNQTNLQERMNAVEASEANNSAALERLMENLTGALKELDKLKTQTAEFNDVREQLEEDQADIATLKRNVHELTKHRERVGGNFSEIENRLDQTEKKLKEKEAKLDNLETKTVATFRDTEELLGLYRDELSNLNATANDLRSEARAQLNSTKTDFEDELKKIQSDSKVFSAKLHNQKAEVVELKSQTDKRFKNVDEQLKTHLLSVNQNTAAIKTLKTDNTEIAKKLQKVADENGNLREGVESFTSEANTKVAFSASVIESHNVFTGPVSSTSGNLLVFNKVFTNIGNAYSCKTGIFTAPVRGAYQFTFMTFGYNTYTSGAILVKNGHYQVSTWEFKGQDVSDTTSNTVILDLNVGETVNIILWKGGKIHTAVFSGFLIFPL